VAHQVQDEGFHEIQLNGKQLVFLFMAATVVSVVIFLCGVLVGRGVRAERAGGADGVSVATVADTMPQPAPAPPAQPPAGSDPTAAAAPPPVDDLSYFKRLEKSNPAAEQLKPTPGERASAPAPAEKGTAGPAAKPAPRPDPAPARSPTLEAQSTEPAGQGFAVQIAALNVRSEADAIARRLSSKGYAAYVISPANGTPAVYRVRVGKFPTRREAETIAAKLQKEEQFKPWVTR
jgi:septal ring-binding cell division protein DamX